MNGAFRLRDISSRAFVARFCTALRFFFTHTLDRPDLARRLIRLAQQCVPAR